MPVRIENDGGTPIHEQAASRADAELIKDMVFVVRDAGGFDAQIGGDVVEPGHVKSRTAHTDQITHACAGAVGRRQQCAMCGHGLRRVFDRTGRTESAVSTQGIIAGTVAVGATLDAVLAPRLDPIEQAHAALMRDVAGNPGVIENRIRQHGETLTARRVSSR